MRKSMKKIVLRVLAFVLVMSMMTGCSIFKAATTVNNDIVTDAPADNKPTDAAPTEAPSDNTEPTAEPEVTGEPEVTDEPEPTGEADADWDPCIRFLTTDFDGNGWDETCFMDAKVTMINLWAYWCGPCVGELPEIEKLSKDYADKNVQVLGITYPEEEMDNRETAKELGITYPILFYTEDFDEYLDSGYIPMTIFVGENGKLLDDPVIGSRDYAEWASMLDEYLAK